ncbi:hypothetical protein ACTA71_004029 [Dictyostelium dimigraforme]
MDRVEIIKNHILPINNNILNEIECSKIKIFEYKNGCKRIILNRIEAYNSLSIDMLKFLFKKLIEYNDDENCKFVIIHSCSKKLFCSGGDIKEFAQCSQSPTGINPFIKLEYTMNHLIHTFKKPILSFINGITMGGGVGLSGHCTHRIVGDNVQWAMPENRIGYFPDVGSSYLLSRLGSIGLYLGMVGTRINSNDLIKTNLATHYIPNDLLDKTLEELCNNENIKGNNEIDLILNKYSKNLIIDKKSSHLIKFKSMIDKCFNRDFKSVIEVLNQLKKECRNDTNENYEKEWASKTLSILLESCAPTSVFVSFETIKRGLKMNIDQIIQMEIRVGTRIGDRQDLSQGVYKTLIDKSYKPIFTPSSIYNVNQSFIDSLFLPFNDEVLEFNN